MRFKGTTVSKLFSSPTVCPHHQTLERLVNVHTKIIVIRITLADDPSSYRDASTTDGKGLN